MPDDATPAKGDDAPENTDTPNDSVVAQAENPDAVKNALAAERAAKKAAEKRANELAARVEEFENANASEIEKAQGKVTKAEQRAEAAEAKLLRYLVAAEQEVPAEAVDLLQGTTREDLEASAAKILSLVKNRNTNEAPDFDGGPREPAPENKTPEQEHNELVLGLFGVKPN